MDLAIVREFFSALLSRETYDPRRNAYILFGLLWGLPVPVVGVLIDFHVAAEAGIDRSFGDLLFEPLHIFLALHPLFFAVVFGALGTIRRRMATRIQDLLDRLAEKVQRLSRANADLRDLDRLKDEFLGNATHELKTPLVTLRGYAQMLDSERLGPLDPRQKGATKVMRRNAKRLQEQIDRLLAVSRSQTRLRELRVEDVPLAALVAEASDRSRPSAEVKDVDFAARLPERVVVVRGDRLRLAEVLDNLLSNAIKFTESGGSVCLRFGEPDRDRLPAEVVDTGCGIPPEAHERIFDRFRQADDSVRDKYGGSGLGLAIVRSNLEAHGCSIRVESARGWGAKFQFELPLAPEAAPDDSGADS